MAKVEQIYHRDYPIEDSYEGLAKALSRKHEPAQVRIAECKPLAGGRWMVYTSPSALIKAKPSPEEGCKVFFPGHSGVIGTLTRVEEAHDYVVLKCSDPLDLLLPKAMSFLAVDFLATLKKWVVEQQGLLPTRAWAGEQLSCSPAHHKGLRRAQWTAVQAAAQGQMYLWGPPGTGKTHTLGHVVMALLDGGYRVLLLAPTNRAVDQAVLRIDDAFCRCGSPLDAGQLLRAGYPEDAEMERRPHLMAWQESLSASQKAIQDLRRQQARITRQLGRVDKPSERRPLEEQRAEMDQQLGALQQERSRKLWTLAQGCQILACTTFAGMQRGEVIAIFSHPKVAIIVDEAGMVPRYVPIPLLAQLSGLVGPAGGRIVARPRKVAMIYSGDPMQLAPIARHDAQDVNARHWLGDSLMETLPADAVLLDEQSRMDDSICRRISSTYYNGRLKTVADASRRQPPLIGGWPRHGLALVNPLTSKALNFNNEDPSEWAAEKDFNERNIRVAAQLIQNALDVDSSIKVLWLTPFRRQAIRAKQVAEFLFGDATVVLAGTVHVSQGSEADLVIFDPVKPSHPWFRGRFGSEKDIDRMLNVAISRGRTQVLVLATRNTVRRTGPFMRLFAGCDEHTL